MCGVCTICCFLNLLSILMVLKIENNVGLGFKEMRNYNIMLALSELNNEFNNSRSEYLGKLGRCNSEQLERCARRTCRSEVLQNC
jgi:thermostable 8-oxoguanine DNA glycosylase